MNTPLLNACFWSCIFNGQRYTITLGVQWLYKSNILENMEYDFIVGANPYPTISYWHGS